MKNIILPNEINYIAVFLTLRCNLHCDYCINRQGDFVIPEEMSGDDWIEGLSRIQTRQDLPITFQGGEPTLHKDFNQIAHELHYRYMKYLDLLTNGIFDMRNFAVSKDVFKRGAKYASIRFSYHSGMNPIALAMKVWELQNMGYEVGIWGLDNNTALNKYMKNLCEDLNIDFRIKEYLDALNGTYKYPDAIGRKDTKHVRCKGFELLINPSGHIFKCHADLYANRNPIGHILNEDFPVFDYRLCFNYGRCNPCDIKLKTNRLQEYGYCAVEIKDKEGETFANMSLL